MRLWIERLFRMILMEYWVGQPRMRLWIERHNTLLPTHRYQWSASYEAVNWKVQFCCECIPVVVVSLVWGCELKVVMITLLLIRCRSASYEAVNWKSNNINFSDSICGQPRMRLWIERKNQDMDGLKAEGQPRMRLWIERPWTYQTVFPKPGSASYEAVNWKNLVIVNW